MNVKNKVKMYVSVNDVVYPKYCFMNMVVLILSGFNEHSVHLYIGFGTLGAVRHGIIGIRIEVISAAAEIIPEYIIFFFNCIF